MVHFCMASFFRGRGGEYICIQRGGYDAHAQTHKIDLKSIWFASNMYPEPFLIKNYFDINVLSPQSWVFLLKVTKSIFIFLILEVSIEYIAYPWKSTILHVCFFFFVFVCFFCLFVCLFLFCFLYKSHISTFEFKWPTQVSFTSICEIEPLRNLVLYSVYIEDVINFVAMLSNARHTKFYFLLPLLYLFIYQLDMIVNTCKITPPIRHRDGAKKSSLAPGA